MTHFRLLLWDEICPGSAPFSLQQLKGRADIVNIHIWSDEALSFLILLSLYYIESSCSRMKGRLWIREPTLAGSPEPWQYPLEKGRTTWVQQKCYLTEDSKKCPQQLPS